MHISITDPYYVTVIYILSGLVGLMVGSFLNVLIYRVPNHMNIAFPPSHCTTCDYQLKWYDNIPIISYIILGGKCRKCHQHISARYTIVEATNMLLWLLSFYLFKDNLIYAIAVMLILSMLMVVFFTDLENMIIPDEFQITLVVLGIIATIFDDFNKWYLHLASAVVMFLLFYLVGVVVSKSLGREALGGGDIKFAFSAGLILGPYGSIIMMLIASITGAICMGILKRKSGESKEIPFGPFLSVGTAIALLFGNNIFIWYIQLITK